MYFKNNAFQKEKKIDIAIPDKSFCKQTADYCLRF